MPDFRLLGPLEVLADNGEPLALGGPKQRAVLAVLLMRANEVVSSEFLVDSVWGETPPRTVNTSLQNSIAALRKLLGPNLLLSRPPGYVLAVDRESIDLGRFERIVAEARDLGPDERAEALQRALELWRGGALADLVFEPFASPEVHRLEELRLAAIEEWIEAELARGQSAAVIGELESLVAQHPLRERLRGQLMLALYYSGRQAEGLNAYQAFRRALVEQLGLEPSPQLQKLHGEMLRQDVPQPRAARAVADEDHFRDISDAFVAGRLVVVLGTDVAELAARLARTFEYPQDEAQELTRVAQYVSLMKGSGPLYDELNSLLGAGALPTKVHRFFAALPAMLREQGAPHPLLVTTSFDLVLEQAFLDAGEEFDVVSYIASGRHRGRFCHVKPSGDARAIELPNEYATELSLEQRTVILKLHGGLDRSTGREWESFVVTEDDYIDYLAQRDVSAAVPVGLAAKLRRSHFLFLGYGMRDWNLRLILGRIWGGEGVSYRSWAVLRSAHPLERQFWRARAVELLEASLEEYVDALGRYVGVGVAETPA